jgi:hypothetical protein
LGSFAFSESFTGPHVSPVLCGLVGVRAWMLAQGLTPAGSVSVEWERELSRSADHRIDSTAKV